MPGRFFNSGDYRYGFNGQEKDDEVKGNGNSYSFTFRIYDSRLGRFFSVDPLSNSFPWNSPYSFCENRVIDSKEMEGLERYHYTYDLKNGQYELFNFSTEHMDQEGMLGYLAYNLFGIDYKEGYYLHYEGSMYQFDSEKEMRDFDPENPGDAVDIVPILETLQTMEQINGVIQELSEARGNSQTRKTSSPQIKTTTQGKIQSKTKTNAKVATNQKITRTVKTSSTGTKTITKTNGTKGWRVGDPINNQTFKGTTPSWSTVRGRYWKNRALNAANGEFSADNIKRMKKGLAPQRVNPETKQIESMELHHDPPQRDGGLYDVQEVWPSEHEQIDPYRKTGG